MPRAAAHSTRCATPANSPTPSCTPSATASCAVPSKRAPSFGVRTVHWSRRFWKPAAPVPLSLLEAVEALPFATRDAEGIYITEPVRQAIVEWMSGVDAERYQAWRKIAADWIVVRLRVAGRARRWRYLADLLHLLEEPSLRNAFFPTDAAAPPVEPARRGRFQQILDIVEMPQRHRRAQPRRGLGAAPAAPLFRGARCERRGAGVLSIRAPGRSACRPGLG